MTDIGYVRSDLVEAKPAPHRTSGAVAWAQKNLFATPMDTFLTVLGVLFLLWIVPPLTSQYLNLTKNSSLGAAIGYPELFNVFAGTALNQTGRAIECIALTMLVYLAFSLVTSMIMNWYNARVTLVER